MRSSSSSSSCYLLLLLLLHLIPLPQSALLWGIWDLVKFSCIVIIIIRLVELLGLREGPSIVCRVRPVSFVSRSTECKYISPSGYLSLSSSSWAYVSHCSCYVLNFCFILLCFILFYFRVFPALTCRFQLQFQFSVSVPVYSELFELLPLPPPPSSSSCLSFFCSPRFVRGFFVVG